MDKVSLFNNINSKIGDYSNECLYFYVIINNITHTFIPVLNNDYREHISSLSDDFELLFLIKCYDNTIYDNFLEICIPINYSHEHYYLNKTSKYIINSFLIDNFKNDNSLFISENISFFSIFLKNYSDIYVSNNININIKKINNNEEQDIKSFYDFLEAEYENNLDNVDIESINTEMMNEIEKEIELEMNEQELFDYPSINNDKIDKYLLINNIKTYTKFKKFFSHNEYDSLIEYSFSKYYMECPDNIQRYIKYNTIVCLFLNDEDNQMFGWYYAKIPYQKIDIENKIKVNILFPETTKTEFLFENSDYGCDGINGIWYLVDELALYAELQE